MKALVLRAWGAPLSLETVPDPAPGPGEVVVRVRASAPDLLDTKIRAGREGSGTLPLILGHENAGEVADLGEGVEGWKVGEAVVLHSMLTCGTCRFCRVGREELCLRPRGALGQTVDGGYAEYVAVPARNLIPMPAGVGFAEASAIPNAIATPLKVIRSRARLRAGEDVLIVGACGGIGIHGVQIARACGARRVIAVDVDDGRLAEAEKLGADFTVNGDREDFGEAVREITGGRGADVVLEFVTKEATLSRSFAALARGGTMAIVGTQPGTVFASDPLRFVMEEVTVTGSRSKSAADVADAAAWVEAGLVRPVISRTWPLAEGEAALAAVAEGRVLGRAPILPVP